MEHPRSVQFRQPSSGLIRWSVVLALAALVSVVSAGQAAQPGESDLKVTKTASAPSLPVGATLTYTIKAENLGLDPATGVVVTDTLPRDVDYVSASSTAGSCALQNRKLTCSIGALEGGPTASATTATVTLAVIPRVAGTITNTASVKGDQKDSDAANNEASISTSVLAPASKPSCQGIPATVIGSPGNDTLSGTGGPDVIVALGGNDTIVSRAGRDLICAGAGSDYVGGGSAADRAFGGAGKDRLSGRGGQDLLKGGSGNDWLFGGRGSDRLRGGGGADVCRSGPGLGSVRGCER
jgi:uncharacterized repeat protein (TIGR01451 family)